MRPVGYLGGLEREAGIVVVGNWSRDRLQRRVLQELDSRMNSGSN